MLCEIGGQCKAVLIDRSLNMQEVSVWAPDCVFERGSLFDGEIVQNSGSDTYKFVCFDCVHHNGTCNKKMPYSCRISIMQQCFDTSPRALTEEEAENLVVVDSKIIAMHNPQLTRIIHKPQHPLKDIASIWKSADGAPFPSDGEFPQSNDTISDPQCHWPRQVSSSHARSLFP